MLPTTLAIIRAGFEADPTITPAERVRLLKLLRHVAAPAPVPTASQTPQVLSRAETAKLFKRSVRFVDSLAREGILKKIRLPGRRRAIGFLAGDVYKVLESSAS